MSSKFFRLLALFTVLAMILSPLSAKPTLAVTSPEDTLQGPNRQRGHPIVSKAPDATVQVAGPDPGAVLDR